VRTVISDTKKEIGQQAARDGAELIRRAIRENGSAAIVLATGVSQFEMLSELARVDDIDWNKVTAFHLDEYAGMSITHPASFRLYLWQRFVSKLPVPPREFHFINAETDCTVECRRLAGLIRQQPIDVAFIGIGENGHIAFNDPPADFETDEPYLVVNLDEACRRQQLGEGWFKSLDDVPKQAISMSVRQIMKAKTIICTVPERRKAEAVRDAVKGTVTPKVPASILQQHANCTLYLDKAAAALL
jgi:glucosamine-6-phosphate deaminase